MEVTPYPNADEIRREGLKLGSDGKIDKLKRICKARPLARNSERVVCYVIDIAGTK